MNVSTSLSRNNWVLEQSRRKGVHGTIVYDVPGLFGERHGLALAANSGTMINGIMIIPLDIGSNITTTGLKTAHNFEQASRSHGHVIK
eukprot:5312425-Pyramimonas_sp.AAC.1